MSIDPGDSSSALRDAFKPAIGNARNYPLAVDQSGQLAPAFGVTATGTEIVYDRAGREVWRGVSSPVSEIGAALRAGMPSPEIDSATALRRAEQVGC